MKPHRQTRISNKVSSETGVAITVTDRQDSRFETCLNEMERLLKPFAPNERKRIVSDLIKRMVKED